MASWKKTRRMSWMMFFCASASRVIPISNSCERMKMPT